MLIGRCFSLCMISPQIFKTVAGLFCSYSKTFAMGKLSKYGSTNCSHSSFLASLYSLVFITAPPFLSKRAEMRTHTYMRFLFILAVRLRTYEMRDGRRLYPPHTAYPICCAPSK